MRVLIGVILTIATILSGVESKKDKPQVPDDISGEDSTLMDRTMKGYLGFWRGFTGGYFNNRDYELNKHCLGPKSKKKVEYVVDWTQYGSLEDVTKYVKALLYVWTNQFTYCGWQEVW